MSLLARREHAGEELRRKLLARQYPEPLVDSVLAQLREQDLLSDRRFAESYCRMRAGKGYGPQRIVLELRQRGVDESEARQALEQLALDWGEQARAARRKRFASSAPRQARERARQWRFLQQRGFGREHIQYALNDEEG